MRRAGWLVPAILALAVLPPLLAPPGAATSYPSAAWSAAASCNYTASNREASQNIDMIVIHTAQGSYSGTISWFKNCAAGASSHYVVSRTGAITAMVRDEDVAWHAGHWTTNLRSIGIEHEGFVSDPNAYTDAMYRASAALSRWLAQRYAIPVDRAHIIGHNEVPGCSSGSGGGSSCHTDPGRYWNWDHYMSLVRGGDATAPSVPALSEDHTGAAWSAHDSPRWTWVASDPESGVSTYELDPSWLGTLQTSATSYHPALGTGAHSLRVRAQNGAGLWSAWSGAVTARVDVTPPSAPSISETHAGTAWTSHAHPALAWSASADAGSGVAAYEVRVDGARVATVGAPGWHGVVADGARALTVVAVDGVGWRSAASNAVTVRVDTTPPATEIRPSGAYVSGGTTWLGPATPIALAATDAHAGVAWTRYAFDGGAARAYAGAFNASALAEGAHALDAWSADAAGNVEAPKRLAFSLDRTPPALAVRSPGEGAVVLTTGAVDVVADAADALTGVARVAFAVDGVVRAVDEEAPFAWAWPAVDEAAGPHYLTVVAADRVGNAAAFRVNVHAVPASEAGVAATRARAEAWAASPPPAGLVATGSSDDGTFAVGVTLGDQWVGARGDAA